jgi:hypothetical protein
MQKLTLVSYLDILKTGLNKSLSDKEKVVEMIVINDLYYNSSKVSKKLYIETNNMLVDSLNWIN